MEFLRYSDFLYESKKLAKQKFLDTGKIDNSTFETLANLDPSKTFKYLPKMIEFHLEGLTIDEIASLIVAFDDFVVRKIIKVSDINQYTAESFVEVVEKNSNTQTNREIKKIQKSDAKIVLDNTSAFIVIPTTSDASTIYGSGTKWCTTSDKLTNLFNQYRHSRGNTIYYVIDRTKEVSDSLHKTAVIVSHRGEISEIRNAKDKIVPLKKYQLEVLAPLGISTALFKPYFEEDFNDKRFLSAFRSNSYTIDENGYYSTDGDVEISPLIVKDGKLIIKFKRVGGDFVFTMRFQNYLKTLEGCPEYVGGNFICVRQKELTSLIGGPKIVKGDYTINYTSITNLEGIAEEIGGDLTLVGNKIPD